MIPSKEGSGQGLFNLVKETLKQHGLDIKDCISNCTDGAASYHGQYKGLQSKIAEVAAVYVHTWCYAHVLNLVIMDTSKCFATSISMLDLLQNASSFLKVCYTRMAIWIEVVERHLGSEKMKQDGWANQMPRKQSLAHIRNRQFQLLLISCSALQ